MTTTDTEKRGLTPSEARTLAIGQVIIHVVPVKADGAVPQLSPGIATLTGNEERFLHDKVKGTFRETAVSIEQDDSLTAPAKARLGAVIEDARLLVADSQLIAKDLYTVQDRRQREDGLLVVARGSIDVAGVRRPAVAVMKLATSEGVRLQRDKAGVYSPKYLNDLMLTDQTRVFKTAVLAHDVQDDGTKRLVGCVSDEQVGTVGADFFRVKFLGCMPTRNAAVLTKAFYDESVAYFDGHVNDMPTRDRYVTALKVELESRDGTMSPKDFAKKHLDDDIIDDYLTSLGGAGIPKGSFDKNTVYLQAKDRETRRVTSKGIRVAGDPALFEQLVGEVVEDGETYIRINDSLRR